MAFLDKEKGKIKVTEIKVFNVPFDLEKIKENITINSNYSSEAFKEQIINQAFQSYSKGNIQEAAKYYKYFIDQGFNDQRVFSNYGIILKNLGNLEEAELSTRKAIEINPSIGEAYFNLGSILRVNSKFEEALYNFKKAQENNVDPKECISAIGKMLLKQGKHVEGLINIREGEGSIIFDLKNGISKI